MGQDPHALQSERYAVIYPDLVIFDCDGTLVDTESLHQIALIELLNEWGCNLDVAYSERNFMGKSHKYIFDYVAHTYGATVPDDAMDCYVQKFQSMTAGNVTAIEGAADFVLDCAAKTKVCVASNGVRGNVIASLKAISLMPPLMESQVFTAADVAHGKPAPDLFLYAAKQMGCDPAQSFIAVIEDSPTGVAAGLAAGMQVYWLQRPDLATHFTETFEAAVKLPSMQVIHQHCLAAGKRQPAFG